MSINYSYESSKTKNGTTKTHSHGYSSDKGFYSSNTERSSSAQKTSIPGGPAGLVVAAVGLVGAGIKLAKKLYESQAANKVADLDRSVRNSANQVDTSDSKYNR